MPREKDATAGPAVSQEQEPFLEYLCLVCGWRGSDRKSYRKHPHPVPGPRMLTFPTISQPGKEG